MPSKSPHLPARFTLTTAIAVSVAFAALLWWIHILSYLFGWNLAALGVYPGKLTGLIGLLTAPLVHGDFEHLLSNTLPMILLGTGLLYGYPRSWPYVLAILWIGSGLGVWLIGRESFHFGASGVATGLMFFLLVCGALRRDPLSVVLAMLSFFMYGTMFWGIFPMDPKVSFEAHLSGAVLGIVCAFLFFRRDTAPARRRYRFEDEPEDAEDPIIGDEWMLPEQRERLERRRDRLH